jgi:hypothetical protein
MAHSALSIPGSFYRPKKLPRVIRRQYAVIRLTAAVVIIGLAGTALAWRNILHERLSIDIARQRAEIEVLHQEIEHLVGCTETAASYPTISAWAQERYGWKPIRGRLHDIQLSTSAISERALTEARVAGEIHD